MKDRIVLIAALAEGWGCACATACPAPDATVITPELGVFSVSAKTAAYPKIDVLPFKPCDGSGNLVDGGGTI